MFLSTPKNRPTDDNAAATFCPAIAIAFAALRNCYYSITVAGSVPDGGRVAERGEWGLCYTARTSVGRGKRHRNALYGRESVLYVIPLTAVRWR